MFKPKLGAQKRPISFFIMVKFHFQDRLAVVPGPGIEWLFLEAAVTRRAKSVVEGEALQDRGPDYMELLVQNSLLYLVHPK